MPEKSRDRRYPVLPYVARGNINSSMSTTVLLRLTVLPTASSTFSTSESQPSIVCIVHIDINTLVPKDSCARSTL